MEREPNLAVAEAEATAQREISLRQRFLNSRLGILMTSAVATVGLITGVSETANADIAVPTGLSLDQVQKCHDEALAEPDLLYQPHMTRAGIRTEQYTSGNFIYQPLEDYCSPQFFRIGRIQEEIFKYGKWVKTTINYMTDLGNGLQPSEYRSGPSHPEPAYVYAECINGHFQKDRLVLTNILKTGENGHRSVVDKAQYIEPVKEYGHCKQAVHSRQRYEKLNANHSNQAG